MAKVCVCVCATNSFCLAQSYSVEEFVRCSENSLVCSGRGFAVSCGEQMTCFSTGRFECPPYSESTKRSAYHVRSCDVFRLKQVGHESNEVERCKACVCVCPAHRIHRYHAVT